MTRISAAVRTFGKFHTKSTHTHAPELTFFFDTHYILRIVDGQTKSIVFSVLVYIFEMIRTMNI